MRAGRRAVLLAALGLAAVAPPAAAADDGALPLPQAPDPVALATEIAADAGLGDVLPTLPVETPLELPAAPAPLPTAPPPAPPPPEPAPAPAAPAQPAPQPDPVPQPDAPAVQTAPANVNVSVRVDSPGDDGAVEQVNAAVELPAPQYPPAPEQYQPAVPPPDAPAEAAPAAPPAASAPQEPGWEWSWSWDCADGAVPTVDLPPGAASRSWTWNWNWNCGATPAADDAGTDVSGYHPIPVQYRPVNINVSIRINSPGHNGPVKQTNVAVGVFVPPPPAITVTVPTPVPVAVASMPPPAQLLATFGPTFAAAAPAEPAAPAASGADASNELLPMPASARPSAAVAPERPASIFAGGAAAAADIASLPVDTVAVAARLELKARGAAHAAEAVPRPQARPARPAPRPQHGEEEGPAVAPHDSLGFAPVGGPERTLPFAALVLLAFMFASTHSTLVAARSRPTHEAEADAPPDRPG